MGVYDGKLLKSMGCQATENILHNTYNRSTAQADRTQKIHMLGAVAIM
ncbi:hypothetical protein SDC9_176505 [bioreactor metagenome]|uniref:Uncharacterized protein n=1 Tax=bioreactor metagenome TaxID=1076179 RepID=A0A645GQ92_9ZZZZ